MKIHSIIYSLPSIPPYLWVQSIADGVELYYLLLKKLNGLMQFKLLTFKSQLYIISKYLALVKSMCISTDGKDAGWHLETGLLTQLEVFYSLYLWGERGKI